MSQVDCFLQIPGIEGESQDGQFKDAIDVFEWGWSEENHCSFGVGKGGGVGKVSMDNLTLTIPFGKASPELMISCATGKHLESATLTCRRAGGGQEVYLVVTLTEVVVTSYKTGGGSGVELPKDDIQLCFAKIQVDYRPQKSTGSHGSSFLVGYDLKLGDKV